MNASYRIALAAVWLALLIATGWLIGQHLQLSGDLRKFMPGCDNNCRTRVSKAARAADGVTAMTFFAVTHIGTGA